MDSREVPGRRINIWLLRAVFSAASIAVMLFLICVALDHKAPPDLTQTGSYSTRLGEHLCQHLPDDSQVCLNTNSAIRYSFSRNTRNVEVVSGEVSFTVRSDSTRPFNVLAGDALVHDLSTSFNVYRKPDSTLVTVIDGRVSRSDMTCARSSFSRRPQTPGNQLPNTSAFSRSNSTKPRGSCMSVIS